MVRVFAAIMHDSCMRTTLPAGVSPQMDNVIDAKLHGNVMQQHLYCITEYNLEVRSGERT